MPTIAIDFDKTLTEDSGDPYKTGDETPDREVIDNVRWLKEEKHYNIIIWTARPWDHARHIAGTCTLWGVPFNGLMCEKGGADAYVDDKATNSHSPFWLADSVALVEAAHE